MNERAAKQQFSTSANNALSRAGRTLPGFMLHDESRHQPLADVSFAAIA
jgi:hypothetical protein